MGTETTNDYTETAAAVMNGDMTAFEILYRESAPVFRRHVMKYIKDEQDVETTLQDIYVWIFHHIRTLNDPLDFLDWGISICRDMSIRRVRDGIGEEHDPGQASDPRGAEAESHEAFPAASSYRAGYNMEAKMSAQEAGGLVKKILDELSDVQRVCIAGWQEQMTIEELAGGLGISAERVHANICQGKEQVESQVLEIEKQGRDLCGMEALPFFLWIMDVYDASFIPERPMFSEVTEFVQLVNRIQNPSGAETAVSPAPHREEAPAVTPGGKGKTPPKIVRVIVTVVAVVFISAAAGLMLYSWFAENKSEKSGQDATAEAPANSPSKGDEPKDIPEELGLNYIGGKEIQGSWILSKKEVAEADPDSLLQGCTAYTETDLDGDSVNEILTVSVDNGREDTYDIVLTVYESENEAWVKADEQVYGDYYLMVCPDARVDVFLKNGTVFISNIYDAWLYEPYWYLSAYCYDGESMSEKYVASDENSEEVWSAIYLEGDETTEYLGESKDKILKNMRALGLDVSDVGLEESLAVIHQDTAKELIPLCRIQGTTNEAPADIYNAYLQYSEGKKYEEFFGKFTLKYIDYNGSGDDTTDTVTPDQPEEQEQSGEYICPGSDSGYLDEAQVASLSKEELRLARNEIYARHGRMFDSDELQAYFNGKGWYSGTIAPDEFDKNQDSILNEYEKFNIQLFQKYEN